MPTLVRFFIVLVVLAGLVGAAMVYLANFVQPNTREMTVRIPASRLEPTPIVRPPAAVPAAEPAATATTEPAEGRPDPDAEPAEPAPE
jgi:hypothetical protein